MMGRAARHTHSVVTGAWRRELVARNGSGRVDEIDLAKIYRDIYIGEIVAGIPRHRIPPTHMHFEER